MLNLILLAQAAAPHLSFSLLDWLLSPAGLTAAIGAVVTVLGFVFGKNVARKRQLALGVYHAFHIVEDIAAEREGTGDAWDKATEGLKQLDAYMVANGWRPLKPNEVDRAKLGFQSMHGEQREAVKVQAEAQVKALELREAMAPPSSPQ